MLNPASQAIEEFGREGFYIKRSSRDDCPDCIKGPTGQSISACATCNNQGYIYSYYFIPIRAIISWRKLESRSVLVGAIVISGDCGVAITYDDYKCILKDTDTFVVDGEDMKLESVIPSEQNAIYLLGLVQNKT